MRDFIYFLVLVLIITLCVLFLPSCGLFTVEEGLFDGVLVDASYGGLAFKSCELQFQFGQQSSTISKASTLSRSLCKDLQALTGKRIKVRYRTWAAPCCLTTESKYEITEIVE